MKTKIYVMTHQRFPIPNEPIYQPLQVGSALSDKLGYLRDDRGDHISYKNKRYCELTGLYWMWKNEAEAETVGLCHYRRYFFREGHLLTDTEISQLLRDYDIIVPSSAMTKEGNLLNHYKVKHCLNDLLICRDIIRVKQPVYDCAFQLAMQCNLFTIGNMMITSKEILDSYCKWLFPILFIAEERVDLSGRNQYQQRAFGFLAERLLRVWLLNQKLRIREERVFRVDEQFRPQLENSDV